MRAFILHNSLRVKRLLLQRNRIARIRRYLRFLNARRQLRIAEQEMARGAVKLRARPVYMNLDTGPVCNLKCRFCFTVNGMGTLKRELLQPETFRAIVRGLPMDSLYEVGLFNWGEPLLNPHLFSYIRVFARKGIRVIIHTNFSVRDYDAAFMEALIQTGISEVTVSLDGASQETYEKYRVGGDFQRVTANMKLLAQTKRRLGTDTPDIVYKMLLNRYNQHEVEAAAGIAASMGARFLLQENMGMPEEERAEWTAEKTYEAYGRAPVSNMDKGLPGTVITECRQMWDSLVVNADGAVFPCCLVCTPESAVGNLTTDSFEDIWNGEKMQTLRRYALDENSESPGFSNTCVGCIYRNCIYSMRRRVATDCR